MREILGGNMKIHVAVYEESLFDLRGGKTFLRRGANTPSCPPPLKETLITSLSPIKTTQHSLAQAIPGMCEKVLECNYKPQQLTLYGNSSGVL